MSTTVSYVGKSGHLIRNRPLCRCSQILTPNVVSWFDASGVRLVTRS